MFIIFLLFAIIAVFPFIRISKQGDNEYLSKDTCNGIKGLFLFLVFVRHFLQYEPTFDNSIFQRFIVMLDNRSGQLIVTMFLFYSGYGVFESAKRKGKDYILAMPKKRIWNTWINFAFAVCIYVLVTICLGKYDFSLSKFLLALIGWDSYGNSNWYIFTILVLYFISYLALRYFGRSGKALALIFTLSVMYVLILYCLKDSWWYNTATCYFLGCLWSMYRGKIEVWLKAYGIQLIALSVVIFAMLYLYCYQGYPFATFAYLGCSGAFALIIVQMSRYIWIDSKMLMGGGKNLFPLFIYQRLPMILFKEILSTNGYLYFFACVVTTMIISFIYVDIRKCRAGIAKSE